LLDIVNARSDTRVVAVPQGRPLRTAGV